MGETEKSKYKLKGSKVQGQIVDEVRLSSKRVLVLDGDGVELSDAEHERLSKKYVLHKTAGPRNNQDDDLPDENEVEDESNQDELQNVNQGEVSPPEIQ